MSPSSELIVFADGTEYRRSGECHGCHGKAICCTYIQLPLARRLTADERRWASLHGGVSTDGLSVRIESKCMALTDDGKCSLFGTLQRPQMCADYPELPGLDEGCGYTFAARS